jgi:hypothetical protein
MCALPAYAVLGQALAATTDDDARLALLDAADVATRTAALRYIALSRDPVMRERERRLAWMRTDPQRVAWLKRYYSDPMHAADFISDVGVTFDPRNIERGRTALVPFVLYDKQRELCTWVIERWRGSEGGIVIKPRDGGISWTSVALACTLCLYQDGLVIGFGSRKEEYVDKLGSPKALFWKARLFMQNLPPEFAGGWDATKHAPLMRISFPSTGAVITGESGDGIGRGDRTSLYFIDEAGHLERPTLVDQAFAGATTNCRIDVSTPNGMSGNGQPFYEKSVNPAIKAFWINWRDDPRKDDAWLAKQCAELSPHVVAQEILCDFAATNFGAIIPSVWISAATGLAERLGIKPSGMRTGALDVADSGVDKNAFAVRHGIVLESCESWSGRHSDLLATAQRAFRIADAHDVNNWNYDAAGVGAGIGGFARGINESRKNKHRVSKFLGAAEVMHPDAVVPGTGGRTAGDYFQNFKSQSWSTLHKRFEASYQISKLLDANEPVPRELIEACISINPKIPEISRLCSELGTPTWEESLSGKMKCNKQPIVNGIPAPSPNLADAVMQAFCPRVPTLRITAAVLEATGRRRGHP